MNKSMIMLKTLFLASIFAASAFAQETANVPFLVNVDATVKAQQGTKIVTETVTANTLKDLVIVLDNETPVKPGITPKSVTMHSSRGMLSLGLPSLLYKNADIALYSLSGKRVMHGKAETAKSISHQNIAMGVYLLNVKGNGNTFSTRFTHQGGEMAINVAFEDASFAPLKKEEFGTWDITISAPEYIDSSYTLDVTEGDNPLQEITLRSFRPITPEPMTAKSALQYFADEGIKAGWNLGNTLDAYKTTDNEAREGALGTPAATQTLINGVKAQGFDIVRIGCTWIGHIGSAPEYEVSETRLQRVAEVVGWVRSAGMKAIINIHHDGNYTDPPNTWGFLKFAEVGRNEADNAQVKDQLDKVWTQIANYFKNYGDDLIFETMNEVHSGDWGSNATNADQDLIFDWNQTALNAIRATGGNNATRFVAIPGLGSTEPGTVLAAHSRGKLLPDDPGNGTDKLIVSVHMYAPWRYTVAGVVATQGNELIHTITTSELNHIDTEAQHIKTTFIDNGIAVYYGEWGAPTNVRSSMDQTIKDTHVNYINRVATAANANGILPIIWDDGGNFKILERTGTLTGSPKAGLWKDVLDAYISVTGKYDITGNLGNYAFGSQENGIDPNYAQALWILSSTNVTRAKEPGAKLVLVLTNAPTGSMQFVWQGQTNEIWWQDNDILGDTGNPIKPGVTWDAGTKTLTINLSEALVDYSEFITQPDLNLIIAYYGGDSVNDLGIKSANLE